MINECLCFLIFTCKKMLKAMLDFIGLLRKIVISPVRVDIPFKIQLHFNLCYFPSLGTFPIDLTKTRLQVQGQSQYTEVRYRGMFHALFRIGKEEGVRALYSGYAVGFVSCSHSALKFQPLLLCFSG